jgi:hypothetical protein
MSVVLGLFVERANRVLPNDRYKQHGVDKESVFILETDVAGIASV